MEISATMEMLKLWRPFRSSRAARISIATSSLVHFWEKSEHASLPVVLTKSLLYFSALIGQETIHKSIYGQKMWHHPWVYLVMSTLPEAHKLKIRDFLIPIVDSHSRKAKGARDEWVVDLKSLPSLFSLTEKRCELVPSLGSSRCTLSMKDRRLWNATSISGCLTHSKVFKKCLLGKFK